MREIVWKQQVIKSLKMAAAAFAAIALAGELGLQYSATAGIITVLSIQNTKRETLKSAGKRVMAFLCALLLSGICFRLMGYTLWAFGVYLLLFAFLCLCVGWAEAISMDSVLITHFLAERSMEPKQIVNEALLLFIGTGLGILVNLHLRKRRTEFDRLAKEVDDQIKGTLNRMSQWLLREDKSAYGADCFKILKKSVEDAKTCAAANYNNAVFSQSAYELDYIAMRERQCGVLREIYDNIVRIQYLPRQAEQVAELLGQIERDFHRENTAEGLLKKLKELLAQLKEQPLPESREEFEARAILFYILMQIRQFLEIKKEFACRYGRVR